MGGWGGLNILFMVRRWALVSTMKVQPISKE